MPVEQIAPPPAVASIGHNQPPEGIDDEADDIRIVARGLRAELEVEKPRIPVVKQLTGQLGKITGASVRWTGHKLDVMFEEAAKSIGKTAGKALFAAAIVLEPHVQQAVAKGLGFCDGLAGARDLSGPLDWLRARAAG